MSSKWKEQTGGYRESELAEAEGREQKPPGKPALGEETQDGTDEFPEAHCRGVCQTETPGKEGQSYGVTTFL